MFWCIKAVSLPSFVLIPQWQVCKFEREEIRICKSTIYEPCKVQKVITGQKTPAIEGTGTHALFEQTEQEKGTSRIGYRHTAIIHIKYTLQATLGGGQASRTYATAHQGSVVSSFPHVALVFWSSQALLT